MQIIQILCYTDIQHALKRKAGKYMFRMWGKIMKDNHLVKDMVACCGDYSISRTQMVFNCLDEICYAFDLEKPMWLESTIQDFKYHDKVRFTQDNFIETVDFDYLEIQVIEE